MGDFPSFRLLGFGGIFRRSVIPSFRIWGNFPPFRDSAIPSFRRSGIPAFRVAQDTPRVIVYGRSNSSKFAQDERRFCTHHVDKYLHNGKLLHFLVRFALKISAKLQNTQPLICI